MTSRKLVPGAVLSDLFSARPGWRLEPTSTPGVDAAWCFVYRGEIEFSVTANAESIVLYEMKTDREIAFKNPEELTAWLATHREEALLEPEARASRRSRFGGLFEWR